MTDHKDPSEASLNVIDVLIEQTIEENSGEKALDILAMIKKNYDLMPKPQ